MVSGGSSESGRDARVRASRRLDAEVPVRSERRYQMSRSFLRRAAGLYSKVSVEGLELLPDAPFVLCFSHQNWADPLFLLAAAPKGLRIYFFGPEQADMRRGLRNRLMRWAGVAVPYRPGKRGLLSATARAEVLMGEGAVVAIAGEGRIHVGEAVVMPLQAGSSYLALRASVPVVPVAVNGTGWLGFRRVVRIRVGPPVACIPATSRHPAQHEVAAVSDRVWRALQALTADFADQPEPGRVGRWLTELFNDWPEGTRPSTPAGASAANSDPRAR